MRISSRQFQINNTNSILDQQVKLSKTGNQLATGKRVLTPADDPVAATRILSLSQTLDINDQYKQNSDYVKNRLGVSDSSLGSITDVLQRVRELVVQASSATVSDQDRQSIATELQSRLDYIYGVSNMKDGNGEYMYAGSKGTTPAFTFNGTNYVYNGDDTVRQLDVGPNFRIDQTDPGSKVFMNVTDGNGIFVTDFNAANTGTGQIDAGTVSNIAAVTNHSYTITWNGATFDVVDNNLAAPVGGSPFAPGGPIAFDGITVNLTGAPAVGDTFTVNPSSNQSIFTTMQRLISTLQTPKSTAANISKIEMNMNKSLVEVDNALNHIDEVRATIGGRLNSLDSQSNVNEDMSIQLKETKSNLEDLDYASAVSRHELQLVGLQAAQQTYSKVQGLSLFNYIR